MSHYLCGGVSYDLPLCSMNHYRCGSVQVEVWLVTFPCTVYVSEPMSSTLDEKFGLLQSTKMNDEFTQKGCSEDITKLIRTFLNQLGVIHQVNSEYCLIPSAIDPDPTIQEREILGSFPRHEVYQYGRSLESMDPARVPSSVGPLVSDYSAGGMLGIKRTGLVYRRMLFLPPIASGFWSRLIALCLQKNDFQQLVLSGIPFEYREWSLQPCGPAHRLRSMIGNLDLSWMYWKAGIILYVNEMPVLELYSLRSHEFEDPTTRTKQSESAFRSRTKKVKNFVFEDGNGWKFIPPHFKEVVEVVVPEMIVTIKDVTLNQVPPMSSKILVKALEIVDEVLKNHCEQFALNGIYSCSEMMQVCGPIHMVCTYILYVYVVCLATMGLSAMQVSRYSEICALRLPGSDQSGLKRGRWSL